MTESDIELMAIEQLEGMGYTYVYGPEIESKGSNPLRSYKQVILEAKVLEALQRLNPHLSEDKCIEALKQVTNLHSPICSATTKHSIAYSLKASTLKSARMVTLKVNMLG
jgi:type I site-specific restriction-modification system R (restriction) subunit